MAALGPLPAHGPSLNAAGAAARFATFRRAADALRVRTRTGDLLLVDIALDCHVGDPAAALDSFLCSEEWAAALVATPVMAPTGGVGAGCAVPDCAAVVLALVTASAGRMADLNGRRARLAAIGARWAGVPSAQAALRTQLHVVGVATMAAAVALWCGRSGADESGHCHGRP